MFVFSVVCLNLYLDLDVEFLETFSSYNDIQYYLKNLEAATRGVLWNKVFLEILQNSQENTCAGAGLQPY